MEDRIDTLERQLMLGSESGLDELRKVYDLEFDVALPTQKLKPMTLVPQTSNATPFLSMASGGAGPAHTEQHTPQSQPPRRTETARTHGSGLFSCGTDASVTAGRVTLLPL